MSFFNENHKSVRDYNLVIIFVIFIQKWSFDENFEISRNSA